MMIMEKIKNLKNWSTENDWNEHYTYVVAAKVAYEIIVLYHEKNTPLETAMGNLYVTGLWSSKENANFLERECLGSELPVQELLEIAYKDRMENII